MVGRMDKDIATLLMSFPTLAALPETVRERLIDCARPVRVNSGDYLYREGEDGDALFLLLGGRLSVLRDGSLLGYITRGEPVGEVGLLTDGPHLTTVLAVRDSWLARFNKTDLLPLLNTEASLLMALTRVSLTRLTRDSHQPRAASTLGGGTIAVIPVNPGAESAHLARALCKTWGDWPGTRLITARHMEAELGPGPITGEREQTLGRWLHTLERRHRYVVYAADRCDDDWARECLCHADRVLLVTEAGAPPQLPAILAQRPASQPLPPMELVFMRPEGDPSPHTRAWLELTGARAHYFLHPGSHRDLQSLALQVSGRGMGLVLGGGGARGFAHIGLIRAMEQLQIPIHVLGGTSMGAFLSALMACGFDSVEIEHIARETFVNNNYLNDYTMPRISIIAGKRFLRRLEQIFGERRIEDLRRSYYCISTSLTTGASVVHDRGGLAGWVGTSMAIPGFAPPISYRGELLCDGGVVDNLPTTAMQMLERGTIIASNVSTQGDLKAPIASPDGPDPNVVLQREYRNVAPRFRDILMRTATLTADTLLFREAAAAADLMIDMPVAGYSLFDWRGIDKLIAIGHEHGLRVLEEHSALLSRHRL